MGPGPSIWFTPRAIRLHLVILVVVPSFFALCAWQVERALSGNELSWAYVFEWPFFAGYAVYMWWKFVHETNESTQSTTPGPTGAHPASGGEAPGPGASTAGTAETAPSDEDEEEDEELAAYNRYLAALAARDERRRYNA